MNKLFPNRRKTIGVLINSFDGFYQSPVCKGIRTVASERNFNVLFFSGGALESTVRDERKQNVIYDLVNTDKLDGLIVCSGLLMNYIGLDKFIEFIDRFRAIPMVSIGIDIKDIPSIIFDNKECMHFMVNHLIEHHNYSKIAFITGSPYNPESNMRLKGYKDALKEHNIPIDEELIVKGDFHELAAAIAINELMVNRNKMPEAIVVANDEMAIEVFYRLKQMGFTIGKDIALTGFDNVYEVRSLSPSFTTIDQPIFEMASNAAKFIDLIIAGEQVPQCTYLKGKLIVRESCGCCDILKNKTPLILKESISKNTLYSTECEALKNYLIKNDQHLIALIGRELGINKIEILCYKTITINLINLFTCDVLEKKVEGEFIKEFKDFLFECIFIKNLDYSWNDALYIIRSFVLSPITNSEVLRVSGEIFYMASVLVGNILNKRESTQHFNFKRMYIGTRDIMRGFNSVKNLQELTNVIRDAMPWYGMKQCCLCVFDTPVNILSETKLILPSKSKLILGYNKGILAKEQYIDTLDILPDEFIYEEKRNDLILFPLITGDAYFGYIAFDMNAVSEFVYENFREQISNTLKIQMLFNERIKAEEQLNLAVIELEKRNGELKNSYVIDELTGIFNRRGFYMHGGSLYKSASITGGKVIMCFGDIDGLKKINDTYGHSEGDQAILMAALLIRESCEVDDVLARIGGDEFTIIMANKSTENEINKINEHITSNFTRYNLISKKPYKLTISLGFSVYSQDMKLSFDELLQAADKQLYNQKKKLNILPQE
ncbi:GGDEF domain-containing protein [Clostridium sp.]|uniref:GGDEF domain-containing protein n=1 Tax=Clostridium sp. TaxID=1506 RepID=UPI003FD72D18